MPTAFISYRRADARESALRIYDRLVRDLGERRVFIDLYGIDAGTDFVERLDQALDQCDVCVVVIGPNWMSRSSGASDGTKGVDYVHLEVSRAIAKGVRLLPVLVNGAVIPASSALPPDLYALVTTQAAELRDGTATQDLDRIAAVVRGRSMLRVAGWSLAGALAAYLTLNLLREFGTPTTAASLPPLGERIGLGAVSRVVFNGLLVFGILEALRLETGLDRGKQLRMAGWCAALGLVSGTLLPAIGAIPSEYRWFGHALAEALRWGVLGLGLLIGAGIRGSRLWKAFGAIVVAAALAAIASTLILFPLYDSELRYALPGRSGTVFPSTVASIVEWLVKGIVIVLGFRFVRLSLAVPLARLVGWYSLAVIVAVIARDLVPVLLGSRVASLGVGLALFWSILVTLTYTAIARLRRIELLAAPK